MPLADILHNNNISIKQELYVNLFLRAASHYIRMHTPDVDPSSLHDLPRVVILKQVYMNFESTGITPSIVSSPGTSDQLGFVTVHCPLPLRF